MLANAPSTSVEGAFAALFAFRSFFDLSRWQLQHKVWTFDGSLFVGSPSMWSISNWH